MIDGMPALRFLTPEWVRKAGELRDSYREILPTVVYPVKLNMKVTSVPFAATDVDLYLDSSSGFLNMGLGQLQNPDLTITIDYETARAILIDQDQLKAMNDFASGKVQVHGDLGKLLSLQRTHPTNGGADLARDVKDITI